jgi:hypothetical protein
MNPPYGKEIVKWAKKAHDEAHHALTVALLPARTDTRWWHEYCAKRFCVLLRGRVKFSGKGSAPFPSAIVLFADIPTTTPPGRREGER